MITTGDFKRGLAILVEGQPWVIVDYTLQTPSARGASTLVRVKGRNVLTGQMLDMTFKSGDKFQEPDLERRKINYMYADGDDFHFMDEESFEQFHLGRDLLGDVVRWLGEGITFRSIVFEGNVVGVEAPQFVEMDVVETGPGGRSDMASGKVTKSATLRNGTQIRVPVYLEAGERVVVDTTTGEFVKRAAR
jgi:elongation factor P